MSGGMPQPGGDWAGLRIEERIGPGDAADGVFAAWDPLLERRVALEVLPADADEDVVERFLRETKVAGSLDHPRIVPVLRVGEHEGVAHVVTRFVGGGNLRDELARSILTVDRTTSVIGQIAGALDRAHRSGLVHRAVKPKNILCADGVDDVYLTGFGSTWAPDATPETVHHAAPELLRGEAVGPAVDVYALGCTLFECLTGRVPYPGATADEVVERHLHDPPPRVTDLRPDLPHDFDDIVATALAAAPRDRFATTRALADAVALVRIDPPPVTGPSAVVVGRLDDVTDTAPVGRGRSVFEDGDPWLAPPTTVDPAIDPMIDEPTAVLAAAPIDGDDDEWYADGAAFGVFEEEQPRTRTAAVVIGLLLVAAVVVGLLTWRAVNTDAELQAASAPTTTETTAPSAPSLDLDRVRALVPAGIEGCVEPEGGRGTGDRITLACPGNGVPETLTVSLFADAVARGGAFDAVVAEVGISEAAGAECALGRTGVHRYVGADQEGTVGCAVGAGQVEVVWAPDDELALFRARGGGEFAEYERWWEGVVGRTDAQFPTADEQLLLDALPDELLVGCGRDLPLAMTAPGDVAAVCRPEGVAAEVVSWVRFGDDATMDRWIEARRDSLDENIFHDGDDGCTPTRFGNPDPEDVGEGIDDVGGEGPPPANAAYHRYDVGGTTGRVLCFLNTNGQHVLFWTRDGSRIGSVAVAEAEATPMADLLSWWRDGGHRP